MVDPGWARPPDVFSPFANLAAGKAPDVRAPLPPVPLFVVAPTSFPWHPRSTSYQPPLPYQHSLDVRLLQYPLTSTFPLDKIRPAQNALNAQRSNHHCDELDRMICMTYDDDKISATRRSDLMTVKKKLQNAIERTLGDLFRLDVYGSSENGFGTNRSDLDVTLSYNILFSSGLDEITNKTMRIIEKALRDAGFLQVVSITAAKVPIVKFTAQLCNGTCIEGDISYNNELALRNTRFLKRYCEWTKNDVLSKLGIFIKKWARQCDISDASKGSLSSYGHMILLIHFLQRVQPYPLLPVLREDDYDEVLRLNGEVFLYAEEYKANWSCCTLSVGELFLQYLDYYANFDWRNQVVQIRRLMTLTKLEQGWIRPMCIEAPFDHTQNLGSGISARMSDFISKAFATSRDIFRTLFVKRRCGGVVGRSDVYAPEYGHALLTMCKYSIGDPPLERQCAKCGRIGHSADMCNTVK